MDRFLGETLLDRYGSIIKRDTNSSLQNKKVIGLYFSGKYCKFCTEFTPVLSKFYKNISKSEPSIEIIFISSDKDEETFYEYYNSMPWMAMPYERRDLKEKLVERFNFKTIPQLIFVDNEMNIIAKNGRRLIADNIDNEALIYEVLGINKYNTN